MNDSELNSASDLLANEVAEKIRNKIKYQELRPGDRLTVNKLCKEFGTSETPVKQALNQLVTTGLVVAIPKCGMRVRTFSIQDMKDILEARMMIESFCVKDVISMVRYDVSFAEKLSDNLHKVNIACEKCIDNLTRESFYASNDADSELHETIVHCCHNNQIIAMYENMNTHAGMFSGFEVHTPDSMKQVITEHTEIVNSLLQCNEERAIKAVEHHLYSTIQLYCYSS